MKVLQNTNFYDFLKSKTKKGEKLYDRWELRDISAGAHTVVLEKGNEKAFTEKRIKDATGINDITQYEICTMNMYAAKLSYINRRGLNIIVLIENVRNVRKNNAQYRTLAHERAYVAQPFFDKMNSFKNQLMVERELMTKKLERENAEKMKKILIVKLIDKLARELRASNVDAAAIKQYADALDRVSKVTRVNSEVLTFLEKHNFNVDEKIAVNCSSCCERNSEIKFNITLNLTVLELMIKGIFTCFLNNFESQTGQLWVNNTRDFESDLVFFKHGI